MNTDIILIDRNCLQRIRDAAKGMVSKNLNPDWARAYIALADAADRLDAMQARTEVYVTTLELPPENIPVSIQGEGKPNEIGKECGWAPEQSEGCNCIYNCDRK